MVQAVVDGDVDAGATYCSFEGAPSDGKVAMAGWTQAEADAPMRIVLCTNPIPADVICAWPGTSLTLRGSMTWALTSMCENPEGRELLNHIFGAERFDSADVAELDRLDLALEMPDLRLQPTPGSPEEPE